MFVLPLFLLALCSCSKDEPLSIPPAPESQEEAMTAYVNGKPWAAEAVTARVVGGKMAIMGKAADGTSIVIHLNGQGEGKYDSQNDSANYSEWLDLGNKTAFTSSAPEGSSWVVAQKIDEEQGLISGRFSFFARQSASEDVVSVTNGVFQNVNYQADDASADGKFVKEKLEDGLEGF